MTNDGRDKNGRFDSSPRPWKRISDQVFNAKCLECGVVRKRKPREGVKSYLSRKFCGRACMGKNRRGIAFRKYPPAKDKSSFHYQARRLCPPGNCSDCGSENASDVHHADGDHKNNLITNLVRICRSCHNKRHRGSTPCLVCGDPIDRHGYCSRHWYSFNRYGDPLHTERVAHKNFGPRK